MLELRLFRTSEPQELRRIRQTLLKPTPRGLVRFPPLGIDQVVQQHQFVDTRELIKERLF